MGRGEEVAVGERGGDQPAPRPVHTAAPRSVAAPLATLLLEGSTVTPPARGIGSDSSLKRGPARLREAARRYGVRLVSLAELEAEASEFALPLPDEILPKRHVPPAPLR